ncbi:MAG TPA: hypothetical protein VFO73_04920 [Candidatus Limnocylindrales bacterium]|nr:hypothetical protein [Candidatus Limnocylindrales bacterium]
MKAGRGAVIGIGIVIALAALLVVVVTSFARPASRVETGVVVGVDAVSLTEVRGFTIRTPDGRTVTFRIGALENGTEFPPGHLREHAATATAVRVTYLEEGSELVAVRLEDAVVANPT